MKMFNFFSQKINVWFFNSENEDFNINQVFDKFHSVFKKKNHVYSFRKKDEIPSDIKVAKSSIIFAHVTLADQNCFDYFLESEFETDTSLWFNKITNNPTSLCFFNVCFGAKILSTNKFINDQFDDWVAYEIQLETTLLDDTTGRIWMDLFKNKIKLLSQESEAAALREKIKNNYENQLKKVIHKRKYMYESVFLIPQLRIYKDNMKIKNDYE